MATYITVTEGDVRLLRRNREQVQGNRLRKVEGDEQTMAARDIRAIKAQQPPELIPARRPGRLRRDEPAAARTEISEIGLWKIADTALLDQSLIYYGWVGVRFTALKDFVINYLGGFDNLKNGLQVPYPIRVWRERAGEIPIIIMQTELAQDEGTILAGDYRFTKITPLSIAKDDIVSVVIFYRPSVFSALQEDRYQFCTTVDATPVVSGNPALVGQLQLVETDAYLYPSEEDVEASLIGEEYPSLYGTIIKSVNVNFASRIVSTNAPTWALPS